MGHPNATGGGRYETLVWGQSLGSTQEREKKMRTAILSLGLSSCFAAPGLAAPADDTRSSPLISLADSLEPLREGFNRATDKPRVVAILSPT